MNYVIPWNLVSNYNSSFVIAWCFLSPPDASLFLSEKYAKTRMLLFLFIIGITIIFAPTLPKYGARVTENSHRLFYLMNIGIPFLMIFIAIFYFLKELRVPLERFFLFTVAISVKKEMQQFLKMTIDPIFSIDYKGSINKWNLTSQKNIGYTKDEALGRVVQTHIIEEYQKVVKKVLYNALDGNETAKVGFPLFTRNRRRVMVLLN